LTNQQKGCYHAFLLENNLQMSDEFLKSEPNPPAEEGPVARNQWVRVWENLSQAGMGDVVLRLGTHVLLVAFILIVAWGLRAVYRQALASGTPPRVAALAAPLATPTPTEAPVDLPEFHPALDAVAAEGISRDASMHTDVPSRPRLQVEKYIVQAGDTVFGIA
jgi:hypothetical protein